MKNKIWRNWKMTGAALIMSCSLLMGSGSAVLGAELAESDIFLEDVEAMDPSGESETEQELDLAEVVDEIRTTEAAETLEITEIPEITEFPRQQMHHRSSIRRKRIRHHRTKCG